ncbi:MAG: flavoprotein, partial [Candidatus Rokuibacteriota bacterium]
LEPLARLPALRPHLRLGTRVVAVTRQGFDKLKTEGRGGAPFSVHTVSTGGTEEAVPAAAVIDASGTYASPNPAGAGGIPAPGEAALAPRIFYGIPDVLGARRPRYAGRRVLVIGSGHSAFNVLLDLAELHRQAGTTTVTWAIRRKDATALYGGGAADALPARGQLGVAVRDLVASCGVRLVTDFRTARLDTAADGVIVTDDTGNGLPAVDEIIAVTGFRPDLAPLRELRLALDPSLESPVALAPLIDPNVHSCGTVPPHGADALQHPEPGLYVVGMKSYGRAPTFLMLTGYEQVRSVAAALTGDLAAARSVELKLPETGVCSSAPTACGPEAAVPVTVTLRPGIARGSCSG